MKELFTIFIAIGATWHVENPTQGGVTMINFEGHCKTEYFEGKVLQGGVDTQRHFRPDSTLLSARYMMEGVDGMGKPCKVYIDNQAILPNPTNRTTPKFITDSEYLSSFQKDSIWGRLDFRQDGLYIQVFAEPREQK